MAQLGQVAERVRDLYFQNYPSNDSYLELDDFKYLIAAIYSTRLDAEFQQVRAAGRMETGFSNVEITAQWMVSEEMQITLDGATNIFTSTTKMPVFGFRWDAFANSLQDVYDPKCAACGYDKLALTERKFIRTIKLPKDRVLYCLNSDREIVYLGAKDGTKVVGRYIPAALGLDDDCLLSDAIATEIQSTLELMFKSKNGNFIQKLDDQNQNINPEQQTNPTAAQK